MEHTPLITNDAVVFGILIGVVGLWFLVKAGGMLLA